LLLSASFDKALHHTASLLWGKAGAFAAGSAGNILAVDGDGLLANT
jgi:hypothetical protein